METLKLEKKTAIKLYQSAPDWFKNILNDTFGDEPFTGKIIGRVKTYEDALELADEIIKVRCEIHASDTPDIAAYKKLKLIASVLNEGWIPNWDDKKEYKWYPWFNLSSGFGFAVSDYGYSAALAGAGSRLCFKSEELSTYAGKHFTNLYEEFLTIK